MLKESESSEQRVKEVQQEEKKLDDSQTRMRSRKSWSDYSSHHTRLKSKQAKEAVNSVLGISNLSVLGIKVLDQKTEETFYIGQG